MARIRKFCIIGRIEGVPSRKQKYDKMKNIADLVYLDIWITKKLKRMGEVSTILTEKGHRG